MNAQHTPGPWTLDPCADGWLLISNGQDITAAPFDARDADVRLIAAAPDLLKALRALASTARTFRNVPKDEQEWTSIDDDALEAAFAAITKATGGAA